MLKRFGFAIFAAMLLAIFVGVLLWQVPGLVRGPLTKDDIARYLAIVQQRLPIPAEERPEMLSRLRAWAEADDGKPFYMLNLMRYHERLRNVPGAPAFSGSAREANALYEEQATGLLLALGGFPLYAGEAQGRNVMGFAPGLDEWSRVLVVRYPSRKAFLDLVTDPAYGPIMPYKLMALDVVLVPTAAELVVPDLWIATGSVLLSIFLAAGWVRAARWRG